MQLQLCSVFILFFFLWSAQSEQMICLFSHIFPSETAQRAIMKYGIGIYTKCYRANFLLFCVNQYNSFYMKFTSDCQFSQNIVHCANSWMWSHTSLSSLTFISKNYVIIYLIKSNLCIYAA
jgi:hypothetical protein